MSAPRLALGADVGGTRTKLGVVSEDGRIFVPSSFPTPSDPEALAAAISREIAALRGRHPDVADAPVGVALPGILDESTGTVEQAMNLGWRDVPFREILRAHLDPRDHDVAIGHDVRAGALAEAAWGAGRTWQQDPRTGLTDMVFVPIGTGVAAAVIHGGRLFGDRYTGEIGQVQVQEPFTGGRTRLERVASASAIARRYREMQDEDGAPAPGTPGAVGLEQADRDHAVDARAVVDRARAGEVIAERVLFSALDTLGQALATIISGVGTLPVVIGGGLAEGGAVVIDPLREAIAHRLGVIPVPPVVPATLGMWAGCLGAAHRALHPDPEGPA